MYDPMRVRPTIAPPLLQNAARDGYSIRFANLPPDVLGVFRPSRHEVILSTELEPYPAADRGPVLAHELQHVSDWITQGERLETSEGCLATESNAFHTESTTWLELKGGKLSPAANDLEQEFNAITRAIQLTAKALVAEVSLVPAVLLSVAVGGVLGLVNGVLIAYGRVHAIIITFGTANIFLFIGLVVSRMHLTLPWPVFDALIVGASVAAAWVSWTVIERPILALKSRFTYGRRA